MWCCFSLFLSLSIIWYSVCSFPLSLRAIMLKIMLIITLLKHLFLSFLFLFHSVWWWWWLITASASANIIWYSYYVRNEKNIHVKWADVAVSIIIQKLYYNIVVVFCCLLLVEIFCFILWFLLLRNVKKKLHWFEIEISILFILLSSLVMINDKEIS